MPSVEDGPEAMPPWVTKNLAEHIAKGYAHGAAKDRYPMELEMDSPEQETWPGGVPPQPIGTLVTGSHLQRAQERVAGRTSAEKILDILQTGYPRAEGHQGLVIGLGGEFEAGKDGIADELVSAYGYKKTFPSESLNEALMKHNEWIKLDVPVHAPAMDIEPGTFISYADLIDLVGYQRAKEQSEVRDRLQSLGTNVVRNMIDPDAWARLAREKILGWVELGHPVVMTGVRYPNEAQIIRDLGGVLVWVSRPGLKPSVHRSHESEHALTREDFHAEIANRGSLNQLRLGTRHMHEILTKWRGPAFGEGGHFYLDTSGFIDVEP